MKKKTSGRNKGMSGKPTRFYTGGTFTVLIEMDDIDPAMHDDEATLESKDGMYKQTLKVAQEGTKIDDTYLRLTFSGVFPDKIYTLTYDLKKDSEGNDLGKMIMFFELPISQDDMDNLDPIDSLPAEGEEELIPSTRPGIFNKEASELYVEPDPDADEEAIFLDEEATEGGPED
jgi:hypothetical protein